MKNKAPQSSSKKPKKSKLDSMRIDTNVLLAAHIKEELNKLFYLEPDYDAELEMLKYQYDHEEKIRLGLHASSVTGAGKGFCYREHVTSIIYRQFYMAGKKPPKMIDEQHQRNTATTRTYPIGLMRIFEEGKSIGTKWQRLFMRGKLGNKEDMDVLRLQPDYDLIYTPDAIIELDGKKYVVEIKSQSTFAFKKQKSHPSGMKQLKLYMYLEGIDRGFVLVDDKNDQDFKILVATDVNESDDAIADSLYHLDQIRLAKKKTLKTKTLPECTCGKCL